MINRKVIVVLVAITLIALAIAFSGEDGSKKIEDAYVTADRDIRPEPADSQDSTIFEDDTENIFLVLEASKLEPKDDIRFIFYREEGPVIQETFFNPEKKGTGKITVSLLKKDGGYEPGKYLIEIFLNGDLAVEKISFEVDS